MTDEHKWDVFTASLEQWLAEHQHTIEVQLRNVKTLRALLKQTKGDGAR